MKNEIQGFDVRRQERMQVASRVLAVMVPYIGKGHTEEEVVACALQYADALLIRIDETPDHICPECGTGPKSNEG